MGIKRANVPGYPNMPLSIWGKSTMLLNLLYREGLLPACHIYACDDEYLINGIRVGRTEEEVTTCIWLMVESYAAEGHIDFQDNETVAESELAEAVG
ncbi:MAG: hypothetical protein KAX55_00325 [Propionivibrio sp.]|nr:hypothetical protein [Propionivibrio sp.]